MHQWEIWKFPHPDAANAHPCVILSPEGIANNPAMPAVNVLACTSKRPGDRLKPGEMILDAEDGLDGPTVLKCSFIFAFSKAGAMESAARGTISSGRRQALKNMLAQIYGIYFR